MNEVTARNVMRHCSTYRGVRVPSVEQGKKAFVTLASQQHAGNGCHPLVMPLTGGTLDLEWRAVGTRYGHLATSGSFLRL